MSDESLDQDRINVEALADRAGKLIGRRAMLVSTARNIALPKIALPVLVTYMVSPSAMAGMMGSGK